MDNVLLIDKMMTDIKAIIQEEGKWIDGVWHEGIKQELIFKACVFPLNPNDLKNYPEGFLKNDDRKLITKQILETDSVVILDNKKYIVVTSQKYGYLADVNFYVIRESKVV